MRARGPSGVVGVAAVLLMIPAGLATPSTATAGSVTTAAPETAVVVVLRDDAAPAASAKAYVRAGEVAVTRVFTHAINGFAATTTAQGRAVLEADPAVRYVADDIVATTAAKQPAQVLPNGVNRVEGELSSAASGDGRGAVDVDVAVIDGGFQLDHPDVDVRPGIDCAGFGFHNKDNHGIGVAGVVGAVDNAIGVVGVAPGSRIWAVASFDASGAGTLSDVLCGLEWVTANAATLEVVNMSFGFVGSDDGKCGRKTGQALHEAICRVTAAGVTAVAAAGNAGIDAATRTPAAYSEVITASGIADFDGVPGGLASDCLKKAPVLVHDDTFAYFSNYGAVVDIAAPAMCILSADLGGKYSLYDGTSFASPHVAGAAALYLSTHPKASPSQVRRALINAGRFDYDSAGDPDGITEPLLDVSGF
jgi:subtilisin